jgi:hypothetical protein
MKKTRGALMSRVQLESNETVYWIDCGFYLLPVTSSKLSQFGLYDVKSVNPLASKFTSYDPVFESVGRLEDELENSRENPIESPIENPIETTRGKSESLQKIYRFSCNWSYSFFPRNFLSSFM